jgi:hypothetical protein
MQRGHAFADVPALDEQRTLEQPRPSVDPVDATAEIAESIEHRLEVARIATARRESRPHRGDRGETVLEIVVVGRFDRAIRGRDRGGRIPRCELRGGERCENRRVLPHRLVEGGGDLDRLLHAAGANKRLDPPRGGRVRVIGDEIPTTDRRRGLRESTGDELEIIG